MLPNGFTDRGIYYYADATDPDRFYYIPNTPKSQVTSQGHPAASLMVLDQFAMLQLSSEWSIDSEQLEQLETTIEKQFDLTAISLQPAPLTVESVTLALKSDHGCFEVLETAKSSGYPPFTTVFSVQLNNEQKVQAIAAFNGRKEQLIITYKAAVKTAAFGGNTIAMIERSTDVSTWFPNGNGMDYVQILSV